MHGSMLILTDDATQAPDCGAKQIGHVLVEREAARKRK